MSVEHAESRKYKDMADQIEQSPIFQYEMKKDGFTAGLSIGPFLAKQLEAIDKRSFPIIEREMPFFQLMGINSSEVGAGAQTYSWEQTDGSARWEKIAASGKALPLADVSVEDYSYSNDHYGAAYEVTTKELRNAIMGNRPLSLMKADEVRKAYQEARNYLAMYGDASKNKTGFINDANIVPSLAADGAGLSPDWSLKTGKEMFIDVASAISAIKNASKNKILPNTVALPHDKYNLIDSTIYSSTGDTLGTVKSNLESVFGLLFVPVAELSDSVSVSSVDYDQMIVFERDPLYLEFMQGMEMSMLPGQWNGLTYSIPFEAELVGCVIRKPIAFKAVYGI